MEYLHSFRSEKNDFYFAEAFKMSKNVVVKKIILCLTLAGLAATSTSCMRWPEGKNNSGIPVSVLGALGVALAFAVFHAAKDENIKDGGGILS